MPCGCWATWGWHGALVCVRVGRWVKLHARCGIPPSRMRCCCTDCLQSTRGASFKGRQRHSKGVPLVSVCVCARVWASLCVSPARSWLHLSTTRVWRCVCMCIAWVAATCMRLVGGKKSLSPQAARIRPVCMVSPGMHAPFSTTRVSDAYQYVSSKVVLCGACMAARPHLGACIYTAGVCWQQKKAPEKSCCRQGACRCLGVPPAWHRLGARKGYVFACAIGTRVSDGAGPVTVNTCGGCMPAVSGWCCLAWVQHPGVLCCVCVYVVGSFSASNLCGLWKAGIVCA